MDPTLEQMADALVESGDYRVTRRLQPRTEYHPADDNPKLIAAVVDVERRLARSSSRRGLRCCQLAHSGVRSKRGVSIISSGLSWLGAKFLQRLDDGMP
jgi:hypothetical protein